MYGPTESPEHTLDTELAVATALENLGFTTEIIEVMLDLESIESLPARRPYLSSILSTRLTATAGSRPVCRRGSMPLELPILGCRTSALFETLSKVETKLKLAHADLPTPEWSTDGAPLAPGV